jgi:hypothetical protein
MMKFRVVLIAAMLMASCKTVTTTTTEIRPSRYAVLEFTRPVSHDSIMAYAARAVSAESIKIQQIDDDGGTLMAGPVKFPAQNGQPGLAATVTISTQTSGATTRIRIFASSAVEPETMGGTDARLMSLVQRIEKQLDRMIGH